MKEKNIFEVLIYLIKQQCSYTGELNKDTEIQMLELNSFEFIKLIVAIEDEFGFEFEDEYLVIDRFKTINDVYDYIQNRNDEKDG